MPAPLRIALVEDNPMLRRRLLDSLATQSEVQVVLHAGSAEELLSMLGRRSPDELPRMVLMDIGLPGMDGIEATRRLTQSLPDLEVVMLTVFEEEDKLFESIRVGAAGYLLKDEAPADIVRGLKELEAGGAPMSPIMARKMLGFLRLSAEGEAPPPSDTKGSPRPFELTERELEILRLLVRGQNYNQVGDQLNISPQTVRSHIKNIYKKMHVHSRADAVRVALKSRTV